MRSTLYDNMYTENLNCKKWCKIACSAAVQHNIRSNFIINLKWTVDHIYIYNRCGSHMHTIVGVRIVQLNKGRKNRKNLKFFSASFSKSISRNSAFFENF